MLARWRPSRLIADLAKRGTRGFAAASAAGAGALGQCWLSGWRQRGCGSCHGEVGHRQRGCIGSAVSRLPALRLLRAQLPPAHQSPSSSMVSNTSKASNLTLLYEGKKCIHARFCVTGAPKVFLANVKGPWISPDAIEVDRLVEISHACPSGAIRYQRKDGKHDETAPPVNLIAVREAGPYAVRAEIHLDGEPAGFRATLCRCGASKNKPFCDGSHHEVELQRQRRAGDRQGRHARRARWRARDRPADSMARYRYAAISRSPAARDAWFRAWCRRSCAAVGRVGTSRSVTARMRRWGFGR